MNDKRVWTIGALLLAVVLLFGGYFLGVAPQLAAASAAHTEREGVEAQNEALAMELAILKKDYDSIEQFKSELAALRVAVPDNAELSAFVNELDSIAVASGVTVTMLNVTEARPYAGPMNVAALALPPGEVRKVADALAKAAETGDANDLAAAAALDQATVRKIMDPVESPSVTPQNFVAIPITLEAQGDYARLLEFVASLQNGSRLALVNALSLSKDVSDAAAPSDDDEVVLPSTGGLYKANLSGYIYVLLNPGDVPVDLAALAAAAAAEEAEAAAAAAE